MSIRRKCGSVILGVLILSLTGFGDPLAAQTASPAALTGKVISQAEGAMEGVAVIAQREGSTVLTSVTTDTQGQYSFPRNRMEAGRYTITIRAAGYVLPGSGQASVEIGAQAAARLDLKLGQATKDQLAHQLTNLDWWTSMPGTPAQKDLLVRKLVNCGFCHDMERTTRSRYTAEQFLPVIQRMNTYAPDNTSGCGADSAVYCDSKSLSRFQVWAKPAPLDGLSFWGADAKDLAQYLASVNLSGGKSTWDYPLKTLPRPKGRATQAVVTVYPIPRQPSMIHDLDVDSKGNVWYGDSGWGYLGKLEPKTGKFSEYEAPNYRPAAAAGLNRLVGLYDVQVDTNDNIWAVVGGNKMAYFDPKTEKWVDFEMPTEVWYFITPFRKRDMQTVWTAGWIRQPGGGLGPLKAYRLNYKTGKIEAEFPIMVDKSGKDFSGPRRLDVYGITEVMPFCYQIDRDPQDNFYCADFYGSNIITVDAKTGATEVYPTPTPNAAPRRGRADDEGRFWFGEFWADKVGVFDPSTKSIREFAFSTKYMSAYSVFPDKNGEVWASSNGSDRVVRLNPNTGETTEYLMPVYYDARKVEVDPSTKTTTIWLPNKNLSQLIRIEVQD